MLLSPPGWFIIAVYYTRQGHKESGTVMDAGEWIIFSSVQDTVNKKVHL